MNLEGIGWEFVDPTLFFYDREQVGENKPECLARAADNELGPGAGKGYVDSSPVFQEVPNLSRDVRH